MEDMDCDQKEEFEYEEDSASEESLNESTGNSDEESEEEEEDITTDDEDIQDEKKNDKTSLIASNPIVSQLELFDNLMEVRIKQQEMLLNINKLPQLSTYHTFKKKIGRPFSLSIKGARRCLEKNLRYLLELQEELMRVEKMTTSNKIMKPIKGNCDNNMGMDEEITSDEEIDDDVKKNKTIKGDDDIGSKGEEEEEEEEDDKDDDNDNDDDEDDDEDEEDTPETIKKISNLSYEELINNRHALLRKYRSQLLKELSEKVKLNQPGQSKQGDFKSLTIPINRQIDQVLENKDSLIERSQTKRLAYKVIGKEVDQVIKEEDPTGERCKTVVAKDAEIFDDYDFYVKMMTSLTNRKVSATRDMVEISRRWAELNTLKNRSLKKSLVDQKASKGRKTRYNVIKRLVGMPDVEFSTSIDDKECDAIFNQIFSQSEAESGQSWLFKPVNC